MNNRKTFILETLSQEEEQQRQKQHKKQHKKQFSSNNFVLPLNVKNKKM